MTKASSSESPHGVQRPRPDPPRPAPIRIVMWSGPRNISTALMRSWGNRPDTYVSDEPFYAFYLKRTGLPHPGADEVIARHETDWRKIVSHLTGPVPEGKPVWYQKHMTHHMLPEVGREWFDAVTHCFLIRDPRDMLTSLQKTIPFPTLGDTGMPQQAEIFEEVRRRTGRVPPVIDAREVLENPRGMLTLLCEALEVEFREEMLRWSAGPRRTDGVWAKHWYAAVEKSTEFEPYRPKIEPMPSSVHGLYKSCLGIYQRLMGFRLTLSR